MHPSVLIKLSPDPGYTISTSDFSPILPLPSNVTGINFVQSVLDVDATITFDQPFIMPESNVSIPLCFNYSSIENIYTVSGNIFKNAGSCNISNAIPTTYSGQGTFNSTQTVLSFPVTANPGYYFSVQPTLGLSTGSNSNYTISKTNVLDGSGNIIETNFVVGYKFPSLNVTNSNLTLSACAVEIYVPDVVISAYSIDTSLIGIEGDTRIMTVFGNSGSVFTVAMDGTNLVTNITMGSSGTYSFPISFPVVAANTSYEILLSGDLVSPFVQNNPFTIQQKVDTEVTLSVLYPSGILAASSVVKAYLPFQQPPVGSAAYTISFSWAITPSSNQLLLLSNQPTINYWSNLNPVSNGGTSAYPVAAINLEDPATSGTIVVSGFIEEYGGSNMETVLDLTSILSCVALPTVVTTGITNKTGTEADSGGESITDGGGTISSKGIQWSEFADFNTILGANNEGTGTADFNSTMTGLTSGNTYYVRAYAQNEVGVAYGQVESFQTSGLPTLTTAAVVNVSWDSADSGGAGLSDNGSPITAKGIQWSTSLNFTTIEGSTNDGTGATNFSSSLTGLTETTIYYVRAYATNAFGTGYGQTVSFQTIALPVTGLSWVTTVNNPCNAAPWTISNNNSTIRYDIVDSVNCQGTCADTQAGTATATITAGASDVDMDLDFEGIGEFQAANYEKISFWLNGVEVARANAAGGGLGCVMGAVVKTFITSPPYRLNANTQYTLFINFTTNDAMYHVGAFYEVDLSFTNVP